MDLLEQAQALVLASVVHSVLEELAMGQPLVDLLEQAQALVQALEDRQELGLRQQED